MARDLTQTTALLIMFGLASSSLVYAEDVQWFHTPTKDEWWDAVGETTTINFTGHKHGEPLTDQYADIGVTFDDVGPLSFWEDASFVNDGWGFRGWNGAWIHFDEPMNWIAADFPGNLGYELYSGDDLIYTSFELGMGGLGQFGGLISDKPFDRVFLWKMPSGPFQEFIVFVDDLHFGALPAPGALSVFALALFAGRRRRR